ncbi:hypothetical protein E7811_10175 [Aliigemmobacter aestuarii]|uniref:Uncharacterized protein n=1 Tax=Aliigemmobacter aestuarii TaxID=1445661 RepID=A0A4S3MNN3_9RHOB|nr:hypothetical protein [Gemmobacter aestuarii]THD83634.1 hypothetical protein E7811_10175 [Gemmobacter aestuarii]
MVIGMVLFGFLAGIGGVIWGIAAGLSVLGLLAVYSLAGMVGALSFVMLALGMNVAREPAFALERARHPR